MRLKHQHFSCWLRTWWRVSVTSKEWLSLALVLTIFSVTVIFITGFSKLNCHPFYNVLSRFSWTRTYLRCAFASTYTISKCVTSMLPTVKCVCSLYLWTSPEIPEAHNFQKQKERERNTNHFLFVSFGSLSPSKHTEMYSKYFGAIHSVCRNYLSFQGISQDANAIVCYPVEISSVHTTGTGARNFEGNKI